MEILREADGAPIYLSQIGGKLARKLGEPVKEITEGKRLSEIIREHLAEQVTFTGSGATLAVGLNSIELSKPQAIRFDKVFWTAFSKPIREGFRRFIQTDSPYNFVDVQGEQQETSKGIEIEPAFVPDSHLPKNIRDEEISNSINQWCIENGLKPIDFARSEAGSRKAGAPSGKDSSGIRALRNLIDEIPANERHGYSLPLDLLGRLLS